MKNREMGPREPDEQIPQQEETPIELKKIEEDLESQPKQNKESKKNKTEKVSRRDFLGDMTKIAAGVAAGSFLGGEKEASADEGDVEVQEIQKKNIKFLREAFQKISDGGMGKAENGNLIVHIGNGHYGGLEGLDLKRLIDIVNPHREYIEGLREKSKNAVRLEDKHKYRELYEGAEKIANSVVKKGIIKANHPVSIEDLPGDLKQFEKQRKEMEQQKLKAIKEMNEGSVIQPIDDGDR